MMISQLLPSKPQYGGQLQRTVRNSDSSGTFSPPVFSKENVRRGCRLYHFAFWVMLKTLELLGINPVLYSPRSCQRLMQHSSNVVRMSTRPMHLWSVSALQQVGFTDKQVCCEKWCKNKHPIIGGAAKSEMVSRLHGSKLKKVTIGQSNKP